VQTHRGCLHHCTIGRRNGESAWEQEVASVTGRHRHDVAATSDAADVLTKQNLHGLGLLCWSFGWGFLDDIGPTDLGIDHVGIGVDE